MLVECRTDRRAFSRTNLIALSHFATQVLENTLRETRDNVTNDTKCSECNDVDMLVKHNVPADIEAFEVTKTTADSAKLYIKYTTHNRVIISDSDTDLQSKQARPLCACLL